MRVKRKGLTLEVFRDDIENPRKYYQDSNIGRMICFHKNYSLGDEHKFARHEDFDKWIDEHKMEIACIKPLYLYDHSGLSMSTSPFADKWDSGQVGYIYTTYDLAEAFGYADTKAIENKLENEVFEYSSWLEGVPEYYSFQITDEDDNLIESMGVFELTSKDEMFDEMKERSEHKYDFLFDALLSQEMYL